MTFEQIKELIELVTARRLQGLELERSGFRLKIEGQAGAPPAAAPPVPGPAAAPPRLPAPAEPVRGGPPPAAPEPAAEESEVPAGAHLLPSPIVGTFYRAPAPDADPYVEVGSRVKAGQVLCVVEAMKLMNEIEADVDGTVVRIYPQNASPVEFGEALFAIEPA
ncbi:MAG TPA: acetyl-CoA carboxylase biotin carboxyl carrier protein [Thermoanaerobaculia bacterium]|nr:acetyl-CoA carboxylase biotin carboxyl carrier protein [Thermoanaerobaculia bacterium]